MINLRITFITGLLLSLTLFSSCFDDQPDVGSAFSGEWSIPQDQVFDGGPGRDGIPAIDNPQFVSPDEATFLNDLELVVGYYDGTIAVAYPHEILDWHEIVNDEVNDNAFAVTYCPLTGTAIGWDRTINGTTTTFGVSGLLYNTNLMPFDRSSNSTWSQMLLSSVNGELIDTPAEFVPLVETSWGTWKEMFPNTRVMSRETGFTRQYGQYPYGDYITNNDNLLFPISTDDDRLPRKERVLGVIGNGGTKAYPLESFQSGSVIIDNLFGEDLIVIGDDIKNFAAAYYLGDLAGNNFQYVNEGEVVLRDDNGNGWNIFGQAIEGPLTGQNLAPTKSYIGFWFAWGTFYPGLEIYE